jgi:hypothetical protein
MANLAQTLRQVGYVTPQGQVTGPNAPLAQQLKNYVTNVIPTAAQNLAQQRADIDAAITMGNQGIQIGDREAFERQMAQVPNLMGLTAYHGTPHTIKGKFDISKVGTGEGAQAYGHGMYFAENPEVAIQYQKALSTPFKEKGSASQLLDMANGNYDEALKLAQRNKNIAEIHSGKVEHIESANKTLNILNKMKNGEKLEFGNMYKVDIPDEYIPNMLDYDKPIKDQPEILKKIRTLIKDPDMLKTFDNNVESGITGANVYANYIPTGVSRFDLLEQRDNLLNKYMTKDMGMSDAVKSMNAEDRLAFSQIAQKIDDLKNTPKMVSEVLNSIGIKGIRYLDQGSRGKGGTSNFVVFDPSDVKILEQNSKPLSRKEIIEQELEKVSK